MRVTVKEVQSWIDDTIIKIDPSDLMEEQYAFGEAVVGKLAARFDTSEWVDATSTPLLVRSCIAMLCAAWRYNILFSKSGGGTRSPYSDELEMKVWGKDESGGIINGLLNGTIDLPVDDAPAKVGTLTGFTDDAAKFKIGLEF